MRTAQSLVHLLSGGLVLSFGWFTAALLCALLPVTRPMAGPCRRLAAYNLQPFGRELVRARDVKRFRRYLRTGQLADINPVEAPGVDVVQAALWAPLGAVLLAAHLLHGLAVAIVCFSNPWRTHSFALLGPALFPLGWQVAPVSSGRLNFVSRSKGLRTQLPPRRVRAPLPVMRIAGSASATAAGAVLVLWASYSSTGPLAVPGGSAPDGRNEAVFLALVQHPMPSDLYRVRPEANPPLPLGQVPARMTAVQGRCGATVAFTADQRLARRHLDHALPLGAAAVRASGALQGSVLRRVEKIQALAASLRYAKVAGAPCLPNLTERAVRSASLAARQAEIARLAQKAPPEVIPASLGPSPRSGDARNRHRLDPRRIEALSRMAAFLSPAKADAQIDIEDAAARAAKTAALRSAALPASPVQQSRPFQG